MAIKAQLLEDKAKRKTASTHPPRYNATEREILDKLEVRTENNFLFGLKYHVMRRCFLDLSYYNGFQHVMWNNAKRRIVSAPAVRGRSVITDNKIMPAVQHAVSLATRRTIAPTVRPVGSDFRARSEARIGERALMDLFRRKRWRRKMQKLMYWVFTTGCGFARPYFDATAGPIRKLYYDPSSGLPIPEEALNERLKALLAAEGFEKEYREGDVDIAIHSPFDVYVPDTATDTDDLQWYCLAYRKSLPWIRGQFPKRGKLVEPEEITTFDQNSFEGRLLSSGAGMSGRSGGTSTGASLSEDNSAILKVYIEPPTPENPKGMYAATANGVLLEHGDSPSHTFGLNGCDLVKYDCIERPGSFWPISLVENLIPSQRELNNTRGQISDLRRSLLKPKVLVPRGSAMARSAQSDVAAEVIEYDSAKGAPTWQPFPDVPQGLLASVELSNRSIADISSQHEAMQGQNPSGVRAGYAINLLLERDAGFYEPIIQNIADAHSTLFSHAHQMIKRTWSSPRWVELLSNGEQTWSGWIDGTQLAESAHVVVEAGSLQPVSKAAKQAFVESLIQYTPQLMQLPPKMRADFLEALEIGDASKVMEHHELDVRWAEWAIEMMIGKPDEGSPGVDIPVRPGIDDHEVQLEVARQFQKTLAYDQLPVESKARIIRFSQAHNNALQQIRLMQAQQAGAEQSAANPTTEKAPEGPAAQPPNTKPPAQ